MVTTMILLIVFICQIWLLSYMYPRKMMQRVDYVLAHFPRKDYPKLYPMSEEKVRTVKSVYLTLNYLCIVLGVAAIYYFGILPDDYRNNLNVLDDIPLLFGLVQYFPLVLLELLCFKQLKMMRALNTNTKRNAELQPRRITDYISATYLLLIGLTYITFIIAEWFIGGSTFSDDFAIKLASVTGANILFIFITLSNVYGKKRDPFILDSDRFKQTQFSIQTLGFISIFMTIYLMVHSFVNVYQYNYLEVVINSLYFQIIALYTLRSLLGRFNIEQINFDVYKADANT